MGDNTLARESPFRYSNPAIFFHWTLAILVPALIGLGWYMLSIEKDPSSVWYHELHRSLGITTAILVVFRIGWRIGQAPATAPATAPAWQTAIAKYTHVILYGLLMLMPLTGYLGSSFSGEDVAFFGLPMPGWASKNDALMEQFFTAHSIIAWIFVVLISIHALAALKHLLVNKDGVFQRMWPW